MKSYTQINGITPDTKKSVLEKKGFLKKSYDETIAFCMDNSPNHSSLVEFADAQKANVRKAKDPVAFLDAHTLYFFSKGEKTLEVHQSVAGFETFLDDTYLGEYSEQGVINFVSAWLGGFENGQ